MDNVHAKIHSVLKVEVNAKKTNDPNCSQKHLLSYSHYQLEIRPETFVSCDSCRSHCILNGQKGGSCVGGQCVCRFNEGIFDN